MGPTGGRLSARKGGLKERPTVGAQLASRPPGWRRWEHLENITHFDQSVFKSQTKPPRAQPGLPSQVEQHIWVFHWASPLLPRFPGDGGSLL